MDEIPVENRARVVLFWDELLRELRLPGKAVKMWVEPDADYLHITLEAPEGTPGFKKTHRGGHVDYVPLAVLRAEAQSVTE